jgi:hypothetical protein
MLATFSNLFLPPFLTQHPKNSLCLLLVPLLLSVYESFEFSLLLESFVGTSKASGRGLKSSFLFHLPTGLPHVWLLPRLLIKKIIFSVVFIHVIHVPFIPLDTSYTAVCSLTQEGFHKSEHTSLFFWDEKVKDQAKKKKKKKNQATVVTASRNYEPGLKQQLRLCFGALISFFSLLIKRKKKVQWMSSNSFF